jgi:hypothetical protein
MAGVIVAENNDTDYRISELSRATKRSRILMKNMTVSGKSAQIANSDFNDLEKSTYKTIK